MKVGVYIDGYNLYYGGRGILGGAGLPGWKWLDVRRLAQDAQIPLGWTDPYAERIVYCTARIREASNQSGAPLQVIPEGAGPVKTTCGPGLGR
ncbi:MAG: hypothetical protein ACR2GH_13755 [Pseudonocardia sp.]